jgi:hypothetical protein
MYNLKDSRGRFHQHLRGTFLLAKFDSFCGKWQQANGKHSGIFGHKYGKFSTLRENVGEIKCQIFCQKLYAAGAFLLDKKVW